MIENKKKDGDWFYAIEIAGGYTLKGGEFDE